MHCSGEGGGGDEIIGIKKPQPHLENFQLGRIYQSWFDGIVLIVYVTEAGIKTRCIK